MVPHLFWSFSCRKSLAGGVVNSTWYGSDIENYLFISVATKYIQDNGLLLWQNHHKQVEFYFKILINIKIRFQIKVKTVIDLDWKWLGTPNCKYTEKTCQIWSKEICMLNLPCRPFILIQRWHVSINITQMSLVYAKNLVTSSGNSTNGVMSIQLTRFHLREHTMSYEGLNLCNIFGINEVIMQ